MNIEQLGRRFDEEGISNRWYNISGIGLTDDRFCIEKQKGKWLVYFSERGIKFEVREYLLEEDACDDMYDRVRDAYEFEICQRAKMGKEQENRD